MKSILKRLLFKNHKPKTFPAVRVAEDLITEQFLLKTKGYEINITKKHCVVCHSPFLMDVWMTPEQSQFYSSDIIKGVVIKEGKICARISISFVQRISESENWLMIYKIMDAKCFQVDAIRQFILYRYFKNKNTLSQDKIYSAMYSFPRKVISVSYHENGYYNIFPMDFQCFIAERNLYVLGLRTTNITVNKIISNKKIVIADTDNASIDTLYLLGKHHSQSPLPIEDLPFKVTESQQFKFPIPEFSASYKEIEIFDHCKLGTHMLLLGKVAHSEEFRRQNFSIYHIHFFQSLIANYLRVN